MHVQHTAPAFQQRLLADLDGAGEKMLNEARAFGRARYGVDLDELTDGEKLMVVLAAQRARKTG